MDDVFKVIKALIKRQSIDMAMIFDVGAYVGSFSIAAAECFPEASVYAFEPFLASYDLLKINTVAHSKVDCFNFALGDNARQGILYSNRKAFTNSLLPNADNVERYVPHGMADPISEGPISINTISSIIKTKGLDGIGLLKMDTQGYEKKVMIGAGQYLNPDFITIVYSEVLFVDLYENQDNFEEVQSFLSDKGYRLLQLFNIHTGEQGEKYWADALFVPKEWSDM